MDSFDSFFTALQILAAMGVALPLTFYVMLQNFAPFRKLGGVQRTMIATALGWVAVPLVLSGANEARAWAGQAWLHANCGVVPAPWLGVANPIVAPLPRFLRHMDRRDKAAILNALTTVEPRWPDIDIDSPELDMPRQFDVSMSVSESREPAAKALSLERSSLVLLSHQQTEPGFLYGAVEHEYMLEHGYGIKKLAIQRLPAGVKVLGAYYWCNPPPADPPGTSEAIIRMIRAVLRPEPQK